MNKPPVELNYKVQPSRSVMWFFSNKQDNEYLRSSLKRFEFLLLERLHWVLHLQRMVQLWLGVLSVLFFGVVRQFLFNLDLFVNLLHDVLNLFQLAVLLLVLREDSCTITSSNPYFLSPAVWTGRIGLARTIWREWPCCLATSHDALVHLLCLIAYSAGSWTCPDVAARPSHCVD